MEIKININVDSFEIVDEDRLGYTAKDLAEAARRLGEIGISLTPSTSQAMRALQEQIDYEQMEHEMDVVELMTLTDFPRDVIEQYLEKTDYINRSLQDYVRRTGYLPADFYRMFPVCPECEAVLERDENAKSSTIRRIWTCEC